jgi:hypothetical protein
MSSHHPLSLLGYSSVKRYLGNDYRRNKRITDGGVVFYSVCVVSKESWRSVLSTTSYCTAELKRGVLTLRTNVQKPVACTGGIEAPVSLSVNLQCTVTLYLTTGADIPSVQL